MLPDGYRWRETQGQHQLWHNGRWVALLQQEGERVRVVIELDHPTRQVRGSDRTIAGAKRHVERWIAARLGIIRPHRAAGTDSDRPGQAG